MAKWYDWLVEKALVAMQLTELEIIELEIRQHLKSDKFAKMVKAEAYYKNDTDIKNKKQSVDWKANSQLRLGLYRKLVDQKVGYLLSKEPTITYGNGEGEDKRIKEVLNSVFDEVILKELKAVGREAVIKGVGYAIPYYDEEGVMHLYKVPSQQVIPFYSDERRERVDAFVRVYNQTVYTLAGKQEEIHVEYWTSEGIAYYKLGKDGHLQPNSAYQDKQPHFFYSDGEGTVSPYNWERVPLIVFRYNEDEQSLLEQVKPLIDNLELQASTNADLLADIPKFIYVLKNYGGESFDEFTANLNHYKAIKVRENGGIDKLQADIDTVAVESEIARSRKMLYEAGRSIDTQDDNLGNASGQALKWRYTDLDLDANDFENELQGSIRSWMWFVAQYVATIFGIMLDITKFKYTFNRDMITNESEAIQDARNSIGILDSLTIRENHPWYKEEVESRLEAEQAQDADYGIFDEADGDA